MKIMISVWCVALLTLNCSATDLDSRNQPEQQSPFSMYDYGDRCSAEPNSENTNHLAILKRVNGSKLDAFSSVAKLNMSGGGVCSAVLLAADRMITAAHCFENGNRVQIASFQSSQDEDAQEVIIQSVILHPKFSEALARGESLESNPELANFDLAVIVLKSKTTQRTPIKISPSAIAEPGSLVAVVGFGDNGSGAGSKRFAQSHVGRQIVEEQHGPFIFRNLVLLDSRTGSGACPGDSGGGVFVKRDKSYYLLGIVNGVNDILYPGFPISKCERCPSGIGIAVLAAAHLDFLRKNIPELK